MFSIKRILLIVSIVIICIYNASAYRSFDLDIEYGGSYESNIYHSYDDSLEVASMLNMISFDIGKEYRQSYKVRHIVSGFADFDLYPNYSNRNQSSYGFIYEPQYRYNGKGRFTAEFNTSRRDKDLIDDSGQLLSRKLKKNNIFLGLEHRYKVQQFLLKQYIEFENNNYDETYDASGMKETSYDYKTLMLGGSFEYKFSKQVSSEFTFETIKRDYEERYTYAVVTGARTGGRLGIREFRENTFSLQLDYELSNDVTVQIESEYTKRNENYENFYGYKQWQHKGEVKLGFIKHNTLSISFRSKSKDYENYHTANTRAISPFERVYIDYADLKIESEYEISPSVDILLFFRSYNKTSNDQNFEYHNVTFGTGFKWSY